MTTQEAYQTLLNAFESAGFGVGAEPGDRFCGLKDAHGTASVGIDEAVLLRIAAAAADSVQLETELDACVDATRAAIAQERAGDARTNVNVTLRLDDPGKIRADSEA
jgi:hypothetical protein